MYCKCGAIDYARKVFSEITDKNKVVWTAMVSGYASNGRLEEALELFSQMPMKILFAWTALISGFFQSGEWLSGVKVFNEMRKEGIRIDDSFVISSVIAGVSHLASLVLGKQLQGLVFKLGFLNSTIIGNSLVDMYSKCSDISSARKLFDQIPIKDVVSWTTMLVGEAQHGCAEEALSIFDKMSHMGNLPNEVTFIGLIYACSHAGLVQKGRDLFDSMIRDYHIKPRLQHYTCLVDLLSRSGHLSEAEDILSSMPCSPDEATWAVLLSACNKHKDVNMGIRLSHNLLELKPKDPSTYVLMSNAFAVAGKWDYVAKVRILMDELGTLKKMPGYTWVEVGKKSCIFYCGEAPHNIKQEIEDLLAELENEVRQRGYVPDMSSVMHDLEEVEKVHQLFKHSERLAVSYGLLRSVPGSTIRLIKNLRICGDCHVFLKYVSDFKKRKIVVRDASRFHHFEQGNCSCGDFW
jgi:pentatricopeptide repeat protein